MIRMETIFPTIDKPLIYGRMGLAGRIHLHDALAATVGINVASVPRRSATPPN
jgi:hypothetical protein